MHSIPSLSLTLRFITFQRKTTSLVTIMLEIEFVRILNPDKGFVAYVYDVFLGQMLYVWVRSKGYKS